MQLHQSQSARHGVVDEVVSFEGKIENRKNARQTTTTLNHLTNSFLEGGAGHKAAITPGFHEMAESAQEAEEDVA